MTTGTIPAMTTDASRTLSVLPPASITETNKFEIQQWLHRAALKQHQLQSQSYSRNQKIHTSLSFNPHHDHNTAISSSAATAAAAETVSSATNDNGNDMLIGAAESDDDYVYDIYHAMSTTADVADPQITSQTTDSTTPAPDSATAVTRPQLLSGFHGPIVPVEGLRIDDDSGNVELVFEYDSDWSALGEDDDSDSNAENHSSECVVLYIYLSVCI